MGTYAGTFSKDDTKQASASVEVHITKDVEDYLGGAAWADVVANSGYRRYDDALHLTLDCTVDRSERSKLCLPVPEIVVISGLGFTGSPTRS